MVPINTAMGTKISAFPSATSLAGTELVLIVQSGADKTATVSQLLLPQANNTVLGNVSGSSAAPIALTSTQLATLVAASSGGGTTNFLRADGTWAAPAGGTTIGLAMALKAGAFVS